MGSAWWVGMASAGSGLSTMILGVQLPASPPAKNYPQCKRLTASLLYVMFKEVDNPGPCTLQDLSKIRLTRADFCIVTHAESISNE